MKFQGIYRAFMVPVHHTGMRSPFLRRSSAGSPFRVSLLTGLLIATGTPAFAPAQVNAPERTPSPLFSKALPDLGDETDLSIAAERRLGDSIVRSLYRDPDYLDDPILTDYVQSIWQPLLRSARARVLSNSGVDTLRLWQADVQPGALAGKSPAQQAAALYGAALAAIRMRTLEPAKALVERLAAVAGAPPLVGRLARLLRADIALATEDLASAANALASPVRPALRDEMVLDRTELLLRAQVQTASGQAGQAATDLYRWVLAHPRDFNAWRSLGRAYEVQGRAIAAIRALAQADGLQHDWSAALARLRAAQDLVRKGQWGSQGPDYIEATIVDTRAREIVQMMREQAAQQR